MKTYDFITQCKKAKQLLVRVKLDSAERTIGSYKCEVCLKVNETPTFSSTVTGDIYKINDRFDCTKRCFVYLFTSDKCKMQ